MSESPVVRITLHGLDTNNWRDGKRHWSVASLIEASRGLEPFDLPLAGVFIGAKIFPAIESAKDLAEHVLRMNACNMDYPVILDDEGYIMDGWHRVSRALVEGRETIKAVRFDKTPEPHWVEGGA